MINVDALQKTLSAMPLPQLQQYAALHKNDPYVVAMALSVANMKKQAVTAQQGIAGQQPMPKVVDQDIARIAPRAAAPQQPVPAQAAAPMLPEEQGIGTLPAPNMQGMAGGGIVAFDEGGEVEHYQVGGTTGSALGRYQGQNVLPNTTGYEGMGVLELIRALGGDLSNYIRTSEQEALLKKYPGKLEGLTPTSAPLGRSPSNAEIEQQYLGMAAPTGTQGSDQAGAGKPTADQTRSMLPPVPTGPSGPNVDSVMSGIEKLLGPREKVPEQADIEKQLQERQQPFFEKLDKKITEQKDKLGSSREEAIYMSMMRGGFAAAAGKSPYAFSNIAEEIGRAHV